MSNVFTAKRLRTELLKEALEKRLTPLLQMDGFSSADGGGWPTPADADGDWICWSWKPELANAHYSVRINVKPGRTRTDVVRLLRKLIAVLEREDQNGLLSVPVELDRLCAEVQA